MLPIYVGERFIRPEATIELSPEYTLEVNTRVYVDKNDVLNNSIEKKPWTSKLGFCLNCWNFAFLNQNFYKSTHSVEFDTQLKLKIRANISDRKLTPGVNFDRLVKRFFIILRNKFV